MMVKFSHPPIGTPFQYGGRGPDFFDCYGLVMAIHQAQGITLPDYQSPEDQAVIAAMIATQLPLWQEVPCGPGAVVLLRIASLGSHCGYMLNDSDMIHTLEKTGGVAIQRIDSWQRRILGFYKYVG